MNNVQQIIIAYLFNNILDENIIKNMMFLSKEFYVIITNTSYSLGIPQFISNRQESIEYKNEKLYIRNDSKTKDGVLHGFCAIITIHNGIMTLKCGSYINNKKEGVWFKEIDVY